MNESNLNQALDFLSIANSPETFVLGNVIFKHFSGAQTARCFLSNDDLGQALDEHKSKKTALGFTPALRRKSYEPMNRSQGGKSVCEVTQLLKIDFDALPSHTGAKVPLAPAAKRLIVEAANQAPAKPIFIIDSGGGIHLYFKLKEPFKLKTPADVERIETLNRNLISYFAKLNLPCIVDPAIKDVSRIMRLPGSLNYKYGEPLPVTVIQKATENIYSFEELERLFKVETVTPPEKASFSKVLTPVFNHRDQIDKSAPGLRETLLGDKIDLIDLGHLASMCLAFDRAWKLQQQTGVSYAVYFGWVKFFAQLNRADLAHVFASAHPKYSTHYDSIPTGFCHTQKIIDQVHSFYERGGTRGYSTYVGLGCENLCKHEDFDNHTSPIRHVLKSFDISRFYKKSLVSKARVFSSGAACAYISRQVALVFNDAEQQFYRFDCPTWQPLSDAAVIALIHKYLGEGAEPIHAKSTLDKMKALLIKPSDTFAQRQNGLVFRDGILSLGHLLDFSRPKQDFADVNYAHLCFTPFGSMSEPKIKQLYLVSTLGTNFNPRATRRRFMKFLNEVFQSKSDLISLAQELAGYCLLLDYPFHVFFLLKGPGGNGKGVFMRMLCELVGDQNVSRINFASFNRFSTAVLLHKLLNVTDELPRDGSDWDLLKNLTGGGFTSAEKKHKNPFFFKSTAKHVFSTNQYPHFTDASPAFWDRMKVIPFNVSFRNSEKEVHSLEEQLLEELDGIAIWAVEGLVRLLKQRGFTQAADAKASLTEARLETDSVRCFVDDRCVLDPRLAEYTGNLYRAYQAYCIAHGSKALSHKHLVTRLAAMNVVKDRESPANLSKNDMPRRHYFSGIGYDEKLGSTDLDRAAKTSYDDHSWSKMRPLLNCVNRISIMDNTAYSCSTCDFGKGLCAGGSEAKLCCADGIL